LNSGIQTFSGTRNESGYGVAVTGSLLFVAGYFSSDDAGIGGTGTIDCSGFNGFLLPLSTSTGLFPLSSITSSLVATTQTGQTFNYTLSASNGPTDYSATGLPAGLTLTGNHFSGTAHAAGDYSIRLSATNAFGIGPGATLLLTVNGDAVSNSSPPVIQGDLSDLGNCLAIDNAGNRYVTGFFTGKKDFYPDVGSDIKISAGFYDVFVTRFNADGSHAWTQTFGGSGDEFGRGITTDGTTVYVTGQFNSADARIGASGISLASAGSDDAFVIALSAADGSPILGWGSFGSGIQTFGGTGIERANSIASDATTLYVTGYFDSVNAQIGAAGTSFSTAGYEDAFVLALNASDGSPRNGWGLSGSGIQTFGGTTHDYGCGVTTDGTSVYVSGIFDCLDAQIGGIGPAIGSAV
jgi:hypothetical protein